MAAYITNSVEPASRIQELSDAAERRIPSAEVTPEQLRNRSWYKGPDVFLLVDDYGLFATGSNNALHPLLQSLPFARDIGLRLVLCRNSTGGSRAMYDPVMQRLLELGVQGLTLSGDKSDGPLIGSVVPHRRPPGRASFTSRRRTPQQVQLAYQPPRTG